MYTELARKVDCRIKFDLEDDLDRKVALDIL